MKNTFEIEVNGYKMLKADSAIRWLNLQHCDKEVLPLSIKASQKHRDAAFNFHTCKRIKLKIEINKNGNWKIIDHNYKNF